MKKKINCVTSLIRKHHRTQSVTADKRLHCLVNIYSDKRSPISLEKQEYKKKVDGSSRGELIWPHPYDNVFIFIVFSSKSTYHQFFIMFTEKLKDLYEILHGL